MIIYQGTTGQFITHVRENTISDIMSQNWQQRFGYPPRLPELQSWQNSLPRVGDLVELAGLTDNMIALEYEVPYSQNMRIDCLLFGTNGKEKHNILLIELKQWSSVQPLVDQGNFVETYVGGAARVVAHPSQQAKGYHDYLEGFLTEFENEPPLFLFSCAYCHNYSKQEGTGLFAPIYEEIIKDYPLYAKNDTRLLVFEPA